MKQGILVVSFGSSHKDTREKNIDRIERHIEEAYPNIICYRAFTSDVIRQIINRREGIRTRNVEEALRLMKEEGITHVYVQPTHIIEGIENHKAAETVCKYQAEFEEIVMGSPLLGKPRDYRLAAEAVIREFRETITGKILILMGHGSEHRANASYVKLEQTFRDAGYANVFLATVEAAPSIEDVIGKISNLPCRKVVLAPFMIVSGNHAQNDMAGERDSFRTKLMDLGYEVEVILRGLGENGDIRELLLSHLREQMKTII